jgi:hypothetical protein
MYQNNRESIKMDKSNFAEKLDILFEAVPPRPDPDEERIRQHALAQAKVKQPQPKQDQTVLQRTLGKVPVIGKHAAGILQKAVVDPYKSNLAQLGVNFDKKPQEQQGQNHKASELYGKNMQTVQGIKAKLANELKNITDQQNAIGAQQDALNRKIEALSVGGRAEMNSKKIDFLKTNLDRLSNKDAQLDLKAGSLRRDAQLKISSIGKAPPAIPAKP